MLVTATSSKSFHKRNTAFKTVSLRLNLRAILQTSRKNNKQSDEFGFVKASDDFRLFLIAATILYLKSAWPVAATRISQSRSASSGHNASTPWALRFCS